MALLDSLAKENKFSTLWDAQRVYFYLDPSNESLVSPNTPLLLIFQLLLLPQVLLLTKSAFWDVVSPLDMELLSTQLKLNLEALLPFLVLEVLD